MSLDKVKNKQYTTPKERSEELDEKMKTGLQLSDSQMLKIKEINLRYAERTENEIIKPKLGNWSKYKKLSSIQNDKDKELKLVLSSEQFKKYAQKRDELMWQGFKAFFF